MARGDVAQLVERLLGRQEVAGSNPVVSTFSLLFELGRAKSGSKASMNSWRWTLASRMLTASLGELAPQCASWGRREH